MVLEVSPNRKEEICGCFTDLIADELSQRLSLDLSEGHQGVAKTLSDFRPRPGASLSIC